MQFRTLNARGGEIHKSSRALLHLGASQGSKLPAQADRRTAAVLLSILVGVPLAILPARFQMYDTTPKIAVLCVGAALLLWFCGRRSPGAAALWRTGLGKAFYTSLILGTASLFISAAFSHDSWLSLAGTVWRRLGAVNQAILFFIAAVTAAFVHRDRKAGKTLMLAMEAAGAIASVYAILQYAGWDPLISRNLYTTGTRTIVRPPATLSDTTEFATFLLAPVFIAASLRLHEMSRRWKRTHELIMFLSVAALILTGTRAAVLGIAAGVCVLPYAERARVADRGNLARAGLAALAFGAAIGLFLLLPAGKSVRARFAQWEEDRTWGGRLLIWRDSLPLFSQHAALGIGPELFGEGFQRVESLELARAYPDDYHESPHNLFFEVGIAQGVPGLAIWLALLGLACWSGVICRRRNDTRAPGLFAALIAMIISSQFCPLIVANELYLVALSAALVGMAAPEVVPASRKPAVSPVLVGVARVFALALVFIASVYAAQTALYTASESDALRGDLDGVERSFRAARKVPMPAPNLGLSRRLTSLSLRFSPQMRQEALEEAEQAAEAAEHGSAERFNALYQSGALAIVTRNLPRAETKLRAAIDCNPVWYRPRVALASVLWWEGRDQEAQREATLALRCAGTAQKHAEQALSAARDQAPIIAARR